VHQSLKSIRDKKEKERIAILDCSSGISGDMTVGAFLDLGMDFNFLKRELLKLNLKGYKLSRKKIKREGQRGTQFTVEVKNLGKTGKREVSYKEIKKLLDDSSLDEKVVSISKKLFARLAQAEAYVHDTSVEAVHFHEVGAVDSIIDIVSAAICLVFFDIQKVFVQNIHISSGYVSKTSHGCYSLCAPATFKLLEWYPVVFSDIPYELVTPTGASYIASLTKPNEPIPRFVVEKIGYGGGTNKCTGHGNFLRIVLGGIDNILKEETLILLETNIDDMSPVVYEELFSQLLSCGARDVFVTPIIMKKNRPAHKLSVLFDASREKKIVNIIFSETTTIGVRFSSVRRAILPRKVINVKTFGESVKVKVSKLSNTKVKVSPEYESCKKIAREKKVPFLTVYSEAQYAAQNIMREKPF